MQNCRPKTFDKYLSAVIIKTFDATYHPFIHSTRAEGLLEGRFEHIVVLPPGNSSRNNIRCRTKEKFQQLAGIVVLHYLYLVPPFLKSGFASAFMSGLSRTPLETHTWEHVKSTSTHTP
jgi:hypothetical protein